MSAGALRQQPPAWHSVKGPPRCESILPVFAEAVNANYPEIIFNPNQRRDRRTISIADAGNAIASQFRIALLCVVIVLAVAVWWLAS